jgi:hypothetical protein
MFGHRVKIDFMELKRFLTATTAKSIVGFLMLFGLVFLIYLRNDLVTAIGFAIAIILGRKAVNHIVSKVTDGRFIRRENSPRIKYGT